MEPREEEAWEEDTSVADSQINEKWRPSRDPPLHSGGASRKPPPKELSSKTSGWELASASDSILTAPNDADSYASGDSMTDVAPPKLPGAPRPGSAAAPADISSAPADISSAPADISSAPADIPSASADIPSASADIPSASARGSEEPMRQRSERPTNVQFVDPLVGRVLGKKYRVTRHIASGGMGSVYEAEHVTLGHRVAIKVLHTHLVKKGESSKRFINEAKVAANLDHPNVVRAVDVDETADGIPFFVLEYLDGQPLSAVLGRGRHLPVRRTLQIILQVLSALEAAHEKGIVHRDIKPENIFLLKRSGDQEHVKVLDFGIAKISTATRATSQGKVFGTPMYMSPEQLKDSSNVDERTDIYAVGILLYEMLAGVVPYAAEGLAELMMMSLTTEPTSLEDLRTDLPEGLAELIRIAFSAEREDRPPTASTLRHELSLFLNAAAHMDLERVALDPNAGTLDPEAVRDIQRWRRKRGQTPARPTWQYALAAVSLFGVGLAAGLAVTFNTETAESTASAGLVPPAIKPPSALPSTTVAGGQIEQEQSSANVAQKSATKDETNQEKEMTSANATENAANEQSKAERTAKARAAKAAKREAARVEAARREAARKEAARRRARRRARKEPEEPKGLGFQRSF